MLSVSSLVREASMDGFGKREVGAWGTDGVLSFFLDILFFFDAVDEGPSVVSGLASWRERLRCKVEY